MQTSALLQSPHALRKVLLSSQDNLTAVAGITAPPANMYVPPPFRPTQCGQGAIVKNKPILLMKKKSASSDGEGSAMELNQPTPQYRPPVPRPKPCKKEVPNQPTLLSIHLNLVSQKCQINRHL